MTTTTRLTGRDLDLAVAIANGNFIDKGAKVLRCDGVEFDKQKLLANLHFLPSYSGAMWTSWSLVDRLEADGYHFSLSNGHDDGWKAAASDADGRTFVCYGQHPAEALCHLFLAVKGMTHA